MPSLFKIAYGRARKQLHQKETTINQYLEEVPSDNKVRPSLEFEKSLVNNQPVKFFQLLC